MSDPQPSTPLLVAFEQNFPEASSCWKKWEAELNKEDLSTVSDLRTLSESDFAALLEKSTVKLRSVLRTLREPGGRGLDGGGSILCVPIGSVQLAGARLQGGKYVCTRELGRGEFGQVYLAQASTGENVVIKVMKANSPHEKARLAREATALQTLKSRFVVQLIAFFEEGELSFVVLEHCAGGTLATLIAKSTGPLPVGFSSTIVGEIATGLGHLHDSGFIHRDIKPDNILFSSDMGVKLGDFGLVRSNNYNRDRASSSRFYLPPDTSASPASDMWALGCVVAGLLSGRVLEEKGFEKKELCLMSPSELSAFLDQVTENVSSRVLVDLVRGLLRVDIATRFTAADVLRRLNPTGYSETVNCMAPIKNTYITKDECSVTQDTCVDMNGYSKSVASAFTGSTADLGHSTSHSDSQVSIHTGYSNTISLLPPPPYPQSTGSFPHSPSGGFPHSTSGHRGSATGITETTPLNAAPSAPSPLTVHFSAGPAEPLKSEVDASQQPKKLVGSTSRRRLESNLKRSRMCLAAVLIFFFLGVAGAVLGWYFGWYVPHSQIQASVTGPITTRPTTARPTTRQPIFQAPVKFPPDPVGRPTPTGAAANTPATAKPTAFSNSYPTDLPTSRPNNRISKAPTSLPTPGPSVKAGKVGR